MIAYTVVGKRVWLNYARLLVKAVSALTSLSIGSSLFWYSFPEPCVCCNMVILIRPVNYLLVALVIKVSSALTLASVELSHSASH